MGMVLLAFVAGLILGAALDWFSDYLIRFSLSEAVPYRSPDFWPASVWRQRSAGRSWDWPRVAVGLLLASLTAYLWSRHGPSWQMLESLGYVSLFAIIILTDLRYRLILNAVVYPTVALVLLLRLLLSHADMPNVLLGGAIGAAVFLPVILWRPEALGAGDAKLAGLIGCVLGFPQVLWALTLGILAGGIGALLIVVTGQGGLRSYIPYGPFLCLGAMLVLMHPLPILPGA